MRRIVVVGAGPAGMRCAERLAGRPGMAVTLLGAEPAAPYNRVALSQYLAGDIASGDLVTHDAARLAQLGIDFRAGVTVAGIDRARRLLAVPDGDPIAYDTLVLALGARAFRLNLPGADLPGVAMYRTLHDVELMLASARAGGAAVVIGGGLLGLEAASGLARRGMQVTVVHAADRLMERQLDGGAGEKLARRLGGQGIALALQAGTVAIEGDDAATGVRLSDGRTIPARLVVMAVGIRPESALAAAAGLTVERGIVVDDAMRSSDPAVWAVGECAQHRGACCGLVAPALAQAEVAAASTAGETACYRAPEDATQLKVAGAAVWSAGETEAADADLLIYDDPDGDEYRRFVLRDDRLVGALLYGDATDARWYQTLIAERRPLAALRAVLPFGQSFDTTEAIAA